MAPTVLPVCVEAPVSVEAPASVECPADTTEEAHPALGEVERRRMEVRKLEEVGRLLELSPTQQLALMAAEAGPSTSGGVRHPERNSG